MYHEPLAVISDFGISKKVATNYSKTASLGITTQWAAHEQLTLHNFGRSCDIFSLGLVFSFMCFKAAGFDRVEQRLRSPYAFGYFPGSMNQQQLKNVVNQIYQKIWTVYDRSAKILLDGMLKVRVEDRYKIRDVQRDLESLMLNHDNENFQSHCILNTAIRSSSSSEEELTDHDDDIDFWKDPVVRFSSDEEDNDGDDDDDGYGGVSDDDTDGESADNEGEDGDFADGGGVDDFADGGSHKMADRGPDDDVADGDRDDVHDVKDEDT